MNHRQTRSPALVVKICMLTMYLLVVSMLSGFSVHDAKGRTVTFDELPQRIVLAGRGVLLLADVIYCFPGAKKKVVGISRISQGKGDFIADIDPHYSEKTILGYHPGVEHIAPLHPDVVLLKTYLAKSLGNGLERLGIPVVYCNLESPSEYQKELRTLGKLMGNEERAKEIASYYQKRSNYIRERTSVLQPDEKPNTLMLYYTERGGAVSFNVPPSAWIQTKMIEIAGGNPIWKEYALGKGWQKVGFEQIAQWNPEFIFIISYFQDSDNVKRKLLNDKRWSLLKAVKKNRLFAFPNDYYSWDQPDARWYLGLSWLAKTLHPELCDAIDIMQDAKHFFYTLYGLSEHEYETLIYPKLTGDVK